MPIGLLIKMVLVVGVVVFLVAMVVVTGFTADAATGEVESASTPSACFAS